MEQINKNLIYVFKNPHGTCNVVNYAAGNCHLNSFLTLFDVWHNNGHFKMSYDEQNPEVWFECSLGFMELLQSDTFLSAIHRMGVEVVYEYPFSHLIGR